MRSPTAREPAAGLLSAQVLLIVLIAIAAARFVSLGLYPLLDKSEARYAWIGELMVQTGNWITPLIEPGRPFWAKPVLSTWLTALSQLAFGFNEFAARLSSFLIFVVATWLTFELAARERGRDFGLLAASVFASTALAFYLGGAVMTDAALMLGVTLTMAGYWRCVSAPGTRAKLWGYVFFVGVAVGALAKGPIGVILPGMSIVAWATHQHRWIDSWRRLPWLTGTLLAVVLVVPWYLVAEHRTPGFLRYFIIGEHFERFLVSGWKGDLYGEGRAHAIGSIWPFGFVAMLPWSAILVGLLLRREVRQQLRLSFLNDAWLGYLIYWLLAPFFLFTFARNILLTYVATSLPAFAILTAHALQSSARKFDRPVVTASILAVPVLISVAALLAFAGPGARYLPSQKAIISDYKRLDPNAGGLTYLFDKPYSADFYSLGTAKLAADNDHVMKAMSDNGRYFAIARRYVSHLPPQLAGQFDVVAEHNNTLLLRRR